MANHGVYVSEQATSVSTPVVADSGIPFVIGAAPVQSAAGNLLLQGCPYSAPAGPRPSKSWAIPMTGRAIPLCEFVYSHFQLFGCQPMIACNLLDPSSMKETVQAADLSVEDHKVKLPIAAIDNETLVVKEAGGSGSPTKRAPITVPTMTASSWSSRCWPTAMPTRPSS